MQLEHPPEPRAQRVDFQVTNSTGGQLSSPARIDRSDSGQADARFRVRDR
jgi:hypothetical protein